MLTRTDIGGEAPPAAVVARPLTPPRIYLVRMAVFLILVGFLAFILYRAIWPAFMANPGLNGLIIGVMLIGVVLALRQVSRLFREVRWVNELRRLDGDELPARTPSLLAPMATLLRSRRAGLTLATMRTLLDSVAARLDEGREVVRYLAGLLVFLGLLGTFWGLIDTVGSVGRVIQTMRSGPDAGVLFDELKSGLAAPLSGMGLSFSASLFGLAGSLVLGFLDLQAGQAQGRFYNQLEDWLAAATSEAASAETAMRPSSGDLALALNKLATAVSDGANSRAATQAMANLAEGIQGLVQHMRAEQQMIRDWVEAQAAREKELKQVLDRIARERIRHERDRQPEAMMAVALRAARRGDRTLNYWPAFVDALSTLLLSIVFLLSVFMLAQFFLAREITTRDTVLDRLNRQIAELTDLLALERSGRRTLETNVTGLQSTLSSAEAERRRLQGVVESGVSAEARAGELGTALQAERAATSRAMTQIELLSQQIAAMRRQLAALEDALAASESRDRESQTRIADLGSRLNVALAQRVQELARYRSDFFGRLRQIVGSRDDIRIVGDRFVFQSELFFERGQAVVRPQGQGELDRIASLLRELERQIPPDIPWVLRVDGHTDVRPIRTAQFSDNWALSASRAIAVVQYLIGKGVPPQRLVAAGFGEFQPLDPAATDESYARNRRIELKLTER